MVSRSGAARRHGIVNFQPLKFFNIIAPSNHIYAVDTLIDSRRIAPRSHSSSSISALLVRESHSPRYAERSSTHRNSKWSSIGVPPE